MPRRFTIEVEKDYFNFASAHFLVFANGKREALHGHNYQVYVAVEGEIDRAGVVLDFISFKPVVKQICDELDHRTLIQKDCPALTVHRADEHVTVGYRNHEHRAAGGIHRRQDSRPRAPALSRSEIEDAGSRRRRGARSAGILQGRILGVLRSFDFAQDKHERKKLTAFRTVTPFA